MDHHEPAYWEPNALQKEMGRVLDICHGCRRCWNLCPSFGNVFKKIDEIDDGLTTAAGGTTAAAMLANASTVMKEEGQHAAATTDNLAAIKNPVELLTEGDRDRLVDECFQCGLCFNLCPYHPPHRFNLDFPRLMTRARAVRVKAKGIRLRDRIFSSIDMIGPISSFFAPIVNWLNTRGWNRGMLRVFLGVHPDRVLPLFHRERFTKWWGWRGHKARAAGRVALFYTCSVEYNEPRIGKAAVAVLERNGFEVVLPEQSCCGMPKLDCGDLASAEAAARRNVKKLLPFALQGVPIVALGPTCSFMLKEEYPRLLADEDARRIARSTYDLTEFLMKLDKEGKLSHDFDASDKKIAYQPACHLKNQNIGLKSRDLLQLIPKTRVSVVDRCSGHDGTWSMKEEYFELSMKYAKKLFDEIEQASPDVVSTDCPLTAVQIAQGTGRQPRHPVELLAEAYGVEAD